jgi:hypothetical protein
MVLETELANVKAQFDDRRAVLVVEARPAGFKVDQIGRVRDLWIRIRRRISERAGSFLRYKFFQGAAAPLPLQRRETSTGVS